MLRKSYADVTKAYEIRKVLEEKSDFSNMEVIMSFKKFAMLILTVMVISGFCTKPVAASANDDVNTNDIVAATEVTDGSEATVSPQPTASTAAVEKNQSKTSDKNSKKSTTKKGTASKKSTQKAKYSKKELRLMASIINCEAGAESYQGKLAVGIVVMNRVASKSFPNTVKGVIYQKYQFSPVRNGSLNKRLRQYDAGKTHSKQWKDCISAAKKTLSGQQTIMVGGKTKSLKGYHFFSVTLAGAKFKLGGHRFK